MKAVDFNVVAVFKTVAVDQEDANDQVQHSLDLMRVTGFKIIDVPPVEKQTARFAIDGAIQFGRLGINKPPSDAHWLMEYWLIGAQLAAMSPTDDGNSSHSGTVAPLHGKTADYETQCVRTAEDRTKIALMQRGSVQAPEQQLEEA